MESKSPAKSNQPGWQLFYDLLFLVSSAPKAATSIQIADKLIDVTDRYLKLPGPIINRDT